jgi:hypothetical protein
MARLQSSSHWEFEQAATMLFPSEIIEHYGMRGFISTDFGWCVTVE